MRRIIPSFLVVIWAGSVLAAAPWTHGPLRVSDNRRYLQHADGRPFFWLADTCWLLVQRLDREQIRVYFSDRKAKGFILGSRGFRHGDRRSQRHLRRHCADMGSPEIATRPSPSSPR